MTTEITLSQGKVALVDDEDAALVLERPWFAARGRSGRDDLWYAATKILGETVFMHQLLMPGLKIDHRNGDGLDNRRSNLREATRKQNQGNLGKIRRPTTSRYKGVSWHRRGKKWAAQIHANGETRYLGLFTAEEDAAEAYNRAAFAEWGEFARLNEVGNPQ
jgi:hypothetical protein